jgi:hypothetical protein
MFVMSPSGSSSYPKSKVLQIVSNNGAVSETATKLVWEVPQQKIVEAG